MSVPPRLAQLLELADQGPALRTALAEEVAELLAAWPDNYPLQMRGVCETLLVRAARDAGCRHPRAASGAAGSIPIPNCWRAACCRAMESAVRRALIAAARSRAKAPAANVLAQNPGRGAGTGGRTQSFWTMTPPATVAGAWPAKAPTSTWGAALSPRWRCCTRQSMKFRTGRHAWIYAVLEAL